MTRNTRLLIYSILGFVAIGAVLELPHTTMYKQSLTIEKLDLPALQQRADTVVRGTVVKKMGTMREVDATGEDMVYTRWQIQINKKYKGRPEGKIIVRTMGGQYLSTIVEAEDQPDLSVKEQVFLFLQAVPGWKGDYRIVGEFQGTYKIEERQGKNIAIQPETKTERPEQDLEQLFN